MSVLRFLSRTLPRQELFRIGIGGFTAMCRVREEARLEAQVPTSVLEDASTIQEHVVIQPVRVSIEGVVSRHHLPRPLHRQLDSFLRSVIERATFYDLIGVFAPRIAGSDAVIFDEASAQALRIRDGARRLGGLFRSGEIWDILGDTAPFANLIDRFLDFMNQAYHTRQLLKVDAVDRTYENMAITHFETRRENKHDAVWFTLELQEVRIAAAATAPIILSDAAEAASGLPEASGGERDAAQGEEPLRSVLVKTLQRLAGEGEIDSFEAFEAREMYRQLGTSPAPAAP